MATFPPAPQPPFAQGCGFDTLAPPGSSALSMPMVSLSMSAPLPPPASSLPQSFFPPQTSFYPPQSSALPAPPSPTPQAHRHWSGAAVLAPAGATEPAGSSPAPTAAASAARLRLHYLQRSARAEGEREFERGVGARTRADDHALGRGRASDAVARRRRKTRSAYVSRYAAKQYARLLEEHVAEADTTVAGLRARVADDAARLAAARDLLSRLEASASNSPVSTAPREPTSWPEECRRAPAAETIASDVSDCALPGMGERTAEASC